MENIRKEVLKTARKIEGDSIYLGKGHYHASIFWSSMNYWIGVPIAAIAAVISALTFTKYHIAAGVLAILVSMLTALTTFLNPNEKSGSHYNSFNSYKSLANKINIFCTVDSLFETSKMNLVNKLKEFENEFDELNQNSPQIPKWALNKAKNCLNNKKADDLFCRKKDNMSSELPDIKK